ncbi:type II toxin-antitoxin system RelE/ParE family toxin [Pinirhizobacter soli]|uniref:type II toxin-antitoxin system RelE/ParE family toxin n=1 Tax=Pinirhizobacter soli TaxID=2786953 RepID=UPI00202AB6CE|nr:type II toxin-antitoxin system RelE/ParE family toxin [Pinirhizobacter soli]
MKPEVRRALYWAGSSKDDFSAFPVRVQKNMGVALYVAQLGGMPPSAKPWKGLGPGVFELLADYQGNAFRAVFVVCLGNAMHVLHAFQKKSKSGISTPRLDIEVVGSRLKQVLANDVQGAIFHGKKRNASGN